MIEGAAARHAQPVNNPPSMKDPHVIPSRFENCGAFLGASPRACGSPWPYSGSRHRRERGHLQRGPRRAPASARQSRRKSAALRSPERSGHRRRERSILSPRNSGHRQRPQDHQGTRHFFRDRLHYGRARYSARDPRRRCGRQLLRRDGAPSRAGALAGPRRRWPQRTPARSC